MSLQYSRYLVGIDLGTSNSAVFYVDQDDLTRQLHQFLISQWIDAGQIHARPLLPSYLYLPTKTEQTADWFQNPSWITEPEQNYVVGEWAKTQQTGHPERSIRSFLWLPLSFPEKGASFRKTRLLWSWSQGRTWLLHD